MIRVTRALWQYRHYIVSSIRNEFVIRFARSKLGGLWIIAHPLALVAIYSLVLSNVLSAKIQGIENHYSFAIYLTSGILAWSLFSEITTRSVNLFVINGSLIKKVMFPKVVLPAIAAGNTLLENLMLFLAIFVVLSLLGHPPSMALLWLPCLTFATLILGLGFGLILGILNVFIRDISHVVPIVLQFGFWFTPIVYPVSIIPDMYRPFLMLNPVYPLVDSYHQVMVYGAQPDVSGLALVLAVGVGLLALACLLLHRAAEEMVDVL